ncbi:MAG: helix-turn-helix transcriptional regulator [Myxococcota bacterium]
MVNSRQTPIREIDFDSPLHPDIPIEVIERAELMQRFPPEYFAAPQRHSFSMMILVRAGRGTHTVDFREVPAVAGRLFQTWPGQVQLWHPTGDFDASLVLSRPESTSSTNGFPGNTAHRDLDRDSMATAEALVAALRTEQRRFAPSIPAQRLMKTLVEALGALFDRADVTPTWDELPEAYVAFRGAIESDLASSHNVRDHVRGLGYSERTVDRACRRVTGQSAKGVLSDRLVLEARRLLAHTDKSAATIAAELGFTEPTNFHKFFRRQTSERPSQFRDKVRARAAAQAPA